MHTSISDRVPTQVHKYRLREIAAPVSGLGINGMWRAVKEVTIVPDHAGVAEQLVEQLAEFGITAKVVHEVESDAAAVIYLRSLDQYENIVEAIAVNKHAFLTVKKIAEHMESHGGIFITVQQTGGDFGLRGDAGLHAWTTGLTGLHKTIALEWPAANVKAIDLDHTMQDAKQNAERIIRELLFGGPEIEVGLYADGRRTTMVTVHEDDTEDALAPLSLVSDLPVIIASGGGRGVTAASLIALARIKRCRFVLLGRTPLVEEPARCANVTDIEEMRRVLIEQDRIQGERQSPAAINRLIYQIQAVRDIRHTVHTLQQLGSEVIYLSVDVRDAEQVQQQLAEVRKTWGAVHVLIHGSGALADKRIVDKTEQQFDLVLDTKVKGLYALLEATREDDLQAIILFSSIVSDTGNVGQADYAMANEILNKVAASEAKQRQGKCLVRAIKWGPIDGGMVDSRIKAVFAQNQLALMTIDEVANSFLAELSLQPSHDAEVLICHGTRQQPGWGRLIRQSWVAEVFVDESNYPYLIDHQVKQTVVLPIVQVLEWFYRMATAVRPDAYIQQITNVNVQKGVLLPQFQKEGHALTIHCQVVGNDEQGIELAMALRASSGLVHYTANAKLGYNRAAYSSEMAPPLLLTDDNEEIMEWKWSEKEVYDGKLLFHGPAFQVIKQAKGMTEHAIAGQLVTNIKTDWHERSQAQWHTAPDILDGGMQISRLWAIQHHDLPFLPMRIGHFVMYEQMSQYDELLCVAYCDTIGKLAAKGDMYFYNATGDLIAAMTAVEGFRVKEDD